MADKDRIKSAIYTAHRSANPYLTKDMVVIADTGDVIITYNGKEYILPASEVIEIKAPESRVFEEKFELIKPNRLIPVVNINALKDSEKERVKNLVLKFNKSLTEEMIEVADNADVTVIFEGKTYRLSASDVARDAAPLTEGTGFRIGEK